MSQLYKLFSSPETAVIGLWDCQQCGVSHDAATSWVHTGTGADGRHADVVCNDCAHDLRDNRPAADVSPLRSFDTHSGNGEPTRGAGSRELPPLESAERP